MRNILNASSNNLYNMSDITCGKINHSTNSANNTSTTRTSTKANKPFCSLAYLAKSTVAINSNNDIRVVNGHSNCPAAMPNVAVTAKVTDRGSPSLPTGTATIINDQQPLQWQISNTENHAQIHNANVEKSSKCNGQNEVDKVADVFGIINEEDKNAHRQVDDDNLDVRRPWELANGSFVRRVPSSLMTTQQNALNGLASLTKLNSLDCWDYTIELECLNGPQDLQLAAELGKTLLERNKELETLLKEYKHTIEEQEQEIVYLKKHTTALREVNDSRLKVYEQLEVGIQELERANHRLLVENTSDKKHIKTLSNNIETLEGRCEELTKQLEEVRQALTAERRKNERFLAEHIKTDGSDMTVVKLKHTFQKESNEGTADTTLPVNYDPSAPAPENFSFTFQSPVAGRNANSTSIISGDGGGDHDNSFNLNMACSSDGSDEIIKLVNDLESTKRAFMTEQQRCSELEEQLVAIIQENQTLQGRIAQSSTTEEMRSMHDELSVLDEVRQGQMCSRCLRSMDDRITFNDEQSSMAPTEECEEDEERSLLGLESNRDDNASEHSQAEYRPSMTIKVIPQIPDPLDLHAPGSPNPYRDLVEKYEALLEVQRSSLAHKANNGMSLAEELQSSGEFNQGQKRMFQEAGGGPSTNGDAASSCNGSLSNAASSNAKTHKNRGRTPTEFSEAETSSSGFSDETSNKYTQTDDRPGYFLCSIGDGEDCKFSIYDDVSPIDSRFRNRPEYRELFKEIFAVLKKAAENKEEGEKLPLLDDTHPTSSVAVAPSKVPPVTPANEELPVDFGDDSQSVISSAISEQSFAMSECITKLERKTAKKHINEKNQENKPPIAASISQLASPNVKQIVENGRVLTPLKREPLDYLSVGVGVKKKNRRKNRNFANDRSESPLALPTPPRIYVGSGKKRREMRPFVDTSITSGSPSEQSQNNSTGITSRGSRNGAKYEWNGNSMIIYNRSIRGRNSVDASAGIEYRPSTVSQDLHKLKKLDLSYAEVLRRADACNQHHQQQQQLRRRNHHRH